MYSPYTVKREKNQHSSKIKKGKFTGNKCLKANNIFCERSDYNLHLVSAFKS